MRVTVIGASGYIGSRVARSLAAAGRDVFCPPRGSGVVFEQPLGQVVYAAGLTADFRSRPFDTVDAHVGLLARVLREAQFDSLIYLSSTRIYAGAGTADEAQALCMNPADADQLYNLSKAMGESLCLASGRNTRIARLSNVIGDTLETSENFVYALVREACRGRIVLRSHPDSAKDYIYVDDVVQVLTRMLEGGREPIYNVASGRNTPHHVWTTAIAEMTGCTVEVMPQAPLVRFPEISVDRVRRDYGFHARDPMSVLPALIRAAS